MTVAIAAPLRTSLRFMAPPVVSRRLSNAPNVSLEKASQVTRRISSRMYAPGSGEGRAMARKAKGGQRGRKRRTSARSGPRRRVRAAAGMELASLAPESSTLLVDIHCHVFSGRDIPLKGFLHYGRGIPRGLAYRVDW